MKLERFKKSLEASLIVKMGDYDYFVHPITDGIPRMDPSILAEIICELKKIGDFHCDVIVAPESMGIPIAVPLSLEMGIPYNIVRKKRFGLPGEVNISQVTSYSRTEMFINGISKGDRIMIVDSVLSSGGTLKALIKGLRKTGAKVVDVLVVVEKGNQKKLLEKELGIKIKTLVKIDVTDKKIKILP